MEYNRFKKVIINSPVPEEGVVTGDSLEEAALKGVNTAGHTAEGVVSV